MQLTTDERKRIQRSSLYLLKATHSVISAQQRRLLTTLLYQALEGGVFSPAEEGVYHVHGLVRHLEVAHIALAEMHIDRDSILASLIFRPYQSGLVSEKEIVNVYGSEVLRLIQLLERTDILYLRRESISSVNFHNLLLTMVEDIRIVLLIIADRLYLLRHARRMPSVEEQRQLADEVSFLYAPLAHKLGLYKIKGEMADLCLKYRDRKTFDFIKRKLGETKEKRDAYIARFLSPLREALDQVISVPYEMKGRVKSISSIHNKLRKQQFEDIYDLFAIRIILDVPTEQERQLCWQVYSIVTDMYRPNPERLKDWISIPKSNGYESLHTTVMGPENKWVEVQIRSIRMDAVAEQGVAAHWKYKGIKNDGLDDFLSSVREALESVKEKASSGEARSLESSTMTLRSEEVYVFTPKGEVIKLPKGATVLDFAFTIHSRVGASTTSAKVNGKNVSIKYQLQNGDSVEIITRGQQSVRADWLNIVVSSRAKSRIRQLLRAEEEAGIAVAKEMLQRRIKNRKLPFNESLFIRLTIRRGYKTLTDFYKDITLDRLDVQSFLDQYEQELISPATLTGADLLSGTPIRSAEEFTQQTEVGEEQEERQAQSDDILVLDKGLTGLVYTFAKCCAPVYGDPIFGFASGGGIKIHRIDCPNASDIFSRSPGRIIPAKWSGGEYSTQLISIDVIGKDDIAVVTNITSLIKKEQGVKLRSYSIDSSDGLFRGTFTLYLESKANLSSLLKRIRSAVGVKQVNKVL